jgi:hypothetical protein
VCGPEQGEADLERSIKYESIDPVTCEDDFDPQTSSNVFKTLKIVRCETVKDDLVEHIADEAQDKIETCCTKRNLNLSSSKFTERLPAVSSLFLRN